LALLSSVLDNTPLLAQSGFHSRLETRSILAARLVHDALFRAVEHILPRSSGELSQSAPRCHTCGSSRTSTHMIAVGVGPEPHLLAGDTRSSGSRCEGRDLSFQRSFVVGADSTSVQSGLATICYLPSIEKPERKCWYINKGAVDKKLLSPPTQWCGRPPSNLSHHLKRFRRLKGKPLT
jgi:hypothetical protein